MIYGVLGVVNIAKEQIPSQKQSSLYNYLNVFPHAAPIYYSRTEFYLVSLQQEAPQNHHPISQDVMLMNQLSSPPKYDSRNIY